MPLKVQKLPNGYKFRTTCIAAFVAVQIVRFEKESDDFFNFIFISAHD